MNLNPHDLHFVFNDTANRIQCWDANHQMIWQNEMRNSTVNDGSYGHYGNCPRGEFLLGTPDPRREAAYGYWFTSVNDYGNHRSMAALGRGSIGVHGGGTGLPEPFTPMQGWQVTLGCLRLQNAANAQFVALVQKAQAQGGKCYLTVAGQEA